MVITDVNQVVYQGDGATTAFPFTFRIIDATDIKLLLIDADGTETDITSDYFVDTNTNTVYYPGYAPGAEPGLADQPAPVQTGQRLVVYRELPVTQEKDLGDKWPFFVIELGLDKLTMILQQIYGWWGRAFKISEGTSASRPDFDLTVPIEAGKTFRVNDDGTGFELTEDPKAAREAAEAAQEAAERAQGKAEDAKDAAESAQDSAEDAKDTVVDIASQIDIMARALFYDVVADMVADTTLQAGQTTSTKGYLEENDGGNATYTIREKTEQDVDDGQNVIFLDNGLVAEKIDTQAYTLNMFNAKELPDGADLNDYTTAGTYYTSHGTDTATLKNKPFFTPLVGIRLIVSYLQRDSVIMQELYTNTLRRFVRSRNDDANATWTEWADESRATQQKEVYGQITKTDYGLTFGGQDAAYYQGKLFMFPGSNQQKMRVYDWEGKTLIGEYPLGGDINSHGNTLTFGNKFAATDTYPLLYSSGYNGIDADGVTGLPSGTCQVYRIADDYSTTLVQDIRIGFNSSLPWRDQAGYNGEGVIGYGDYIADPVHNRLYVINSVKSNDIPFTRLFVFTLPDTSVANVTLQESDIIEYYDLPFYPWLQGACYYNNKIYLTSGYNAGRANTTALEVIDLINKKQCGFVDLNDIQTEGEGVVVINGMVYVGQQKWYLIEGISESSNIGNVAQLKGKDNNLVNAINSIYESVPIIQNSKLVTTLTSSDDLDSITTVGTYKWDADAGGIPSNVPSVPQRAGYAKMFVMSTITDNWILQIVLRYNTPSHIRYGHYSQNAWSWGEWKTIAFAEDVLPLTGGTLTGDLHLAGSLPNLVLKNTSYNRGDEISSEKSLCNIIFFDTSNKQLGGVYLLVRTNKNAMALFRANNTSTGVINQVVLEVPVTDSPYFRGNTDNNYNLGTSSYRWKQLYAGTTTISTSDERLKDNITNIPDAVLDAWGEVGWYQYQFKDSIEEKGETKARIHTGAIAQRIESVFESHGLDANKYGLLCYDEWKAEPAERDEQGNIVQEARPAGNRYSLRYEEALCMEAAYQRRRADRLEERIARLEAKL